MFQPTSMRENASLFGLSGKKRARPEPNVAQDFKDFARIEAERTMRMQRWREIYNLFMPNREAFEIGRSPGQTRRDAVDSYPQDALFRGVNNVISALFPPERKWFELVAGGEIPEEQHDEVNEALEGYRDALHDAIISSDFNDESVAMMLDAFASLGAMLVERGETFDAPLRCKAVPLSECYPIAGSHGDIVGMMRKYECECGSIEKDWAGYGRSVTIPASLREKIAKDPAMKVSLLEVSRSAPDGRQTIRVYLSESKEVVVDHVGADPEEPSRWVVSRLLRVAGEVYGRGPADRALESAQLLNFVEDTEAKLLQKQLSGPIWLDIDSGVNPNTVRHTPHAVNPFNGAALNGRAPFLTLPDASNLQLGQIKAEQIRSDLDTILFAKSVLPPVADSHTMTAAEVMVRRQELLREQGANFGRLQREFLHAFIARALWVMRGWGVIPPFLKVDGKRFKVRYAGPLANAQDADDATNVLSFVQDVTTAVGPEAAMLGIRMEDVPSIVGEKRNVPQAILRTQPEREAMQKAIMEAQAAQAQAAMQGQPGA